MRSKIILSAAALFALGACASPMSLRQGKPDLDEVTNSAPERVAGCIGDKLEASPVASQGRLSSRPTANCYSISENQALTAGDDTIVLVDIAKTDNGSRVQLFTHFLAGNGGIPAIIRGCL